MNAGNKDILEGETMFDYLKRKKKFMLEKTLTRHKPNDTSIDNSRIKDKSIDQ